MNKEQLKELIGYLEKKKKNLADIAHAENENENFAGGTRFMAQSLIIGETIELLKTYL